MRAGLVGSVVLVPSFSAGAVARTVRVQDDTTRSSAVSGTGPSAVPW